MAKYAYLICVEGETLDKDGKPVNQNKYYEMIENPGGLTYTASWGRIEGTPATQTKPMSEWDATYKKKLKGKTGGLSAYVDITDKVSVPDVAQTQTAQEISKSPKVKELIETLQRAANIVVAASYKVKSNQVTQKQVDEAQVCINNLSNSFKKFYGKKEWDISKFNTELKKLFMTIPRKMKDVREEMITPTTSKENIQEKIEHEQQVLDTMASQVTTNVASSTGTAPTATQAQKTLLDQMGIEVEEGSKADFELCKAKLNEGDSRHGHRLMNVFKVVNKKTQSVYDADFDN